MERQVSLGEDLVLTLLEFDDALQNFTRGPCDMEEHLRTLKKEQQTSLNSSGSGAQNFNSLNLADENLTYTFSNPSQQPKAKLGDTRELENFISDLDKVLSDF
ncbi:regulator of cell cycle RGCC-like [Dendropsophus ebraccatus]|uniref:regulator of cell cycle RGCC-like n=1 Tax=Dendropsophus ebraccatus TaxID=150705 RepID=UPI0038319921